jgi:hypothetical protein
MSPDAVGDAEHTRRCAGELPTGEPMLHDEPLDVADPRGGVRWVVPAKVQYWVEGHPRVSLRPDRAGLRRVRGPMNIATYNILKGGSQRVHWVRLIDGFRADLLLVQESYPHGEHLPPHLYPDAGTRSAWGRAEKNRWGSAVYSDSGSVKPLPVPCFTGWVVGAEISGASWRSASTLLRGGGPIGSR